MFYILSNNFIAVLSHKSGEERSSFPLLQNGLWETAIQSDMSPES
jgi:hypothetical protein